MKPVDIVLLTLTGAAALTFLLLIGLSLLGRLRGRSVCRTGCPCEVCRYVERSADLMYLSLVPYVDVRDERLLKETVLASLRAVAGHAVRLTRVQAEQQVREQAAAETRAVVVRFAASCTLGVTEEDLNALLSSLFLETDVAMTWTDLKDLRRQLAAKGILTVSGTPLTPADG